MLRYIHRKKQYLQFYKITTWDHNSKYTFLRAFNLFLLPPTTQHFDTYYTVFNETILYATK